MTFPIFVAGCLDRAELEEMSRYTVSVPIYLGCESNIEEMRDAGVNITYHRFSVTSGINNPVTGYAELYSEKFREIEVRNAALSALATCTPNASARIALNTDDGWLAVRDSLAIKNQLSQKVFSVVVEKDEAVIYYHDGGELPEPSGK